MRSSWERHSKGEKKKGSRFEVRGKNSEKPLSSYLEPRTSNLQPLRRILRDPPARVAEREVASAIGPQGHAHSPAPRGWVRGGRVAEGSRMTRRKFLKNKKGALRPFVAVAG